MKYEMENNMFDVRCTMYDVRCEGGEPQGQGNTGFTDEAIFKIGGLVFLSTWITTPNIKKGKWNALLTLDPIIEMTYLISHFIFRISYFVFACGLLRVISGSSPGQSRT